VINNSWGTYHVSNAVQEKINELEKQGIIIVFASGNDGKNLDNTRYLDESELDSVIGVNASDETNILASYSNYGSNLDITAPGGSFSLGIATTDISGNLGINKSALYPNYIEAHDLSSFIGTSAAAPIVTGVVALMLEQNPTLTKDDCMNIFKITNDKIGNGIYNENGFNIKYAYGKINADKAIKMAKDYE
jgi:subtilisin family serine protease